MPGGTFYNQLGNAQNTISGWQQNQSNMSGIGGAALGMLGGAIGAGSQHRRQKELMGIQDKYQRGLTKYGHDLQFDMWNKTNYKAQLEHMKAAGLNPALMYGSAGAPGTTGSQTGGGAAGGQAAAFNYMDMSNMMLMKAQKDDLEATARLKDVQAKKIGGVDTEGVKQQIQESIARETNLSEDTKLKAQQKLNMISDKALTDARTKIENMKFEKGVTGSFLVDTFTQMGLDPMNNTWHRVLINTMIFSWFGAGMMEKIANATTRGMFAKLFGDKSAGKYFDAKAGLDYKSVTQAQNQWMRDNY